MRILNKGKDIKVIRVGGKENVHIYPGTEEDVPDDVNYKIKVMIEKDKELEITTAKKRAIKIFTREELYKMNKDAQVKLLNRYGIETIPKLEGGRVKKLLELQE